MYALPRSLLLAASLITLALPALSQAQNKKLPGEMWKQSFSMEMQGMKMPSRTIEMCVPQGRQDEALARPPDNPNQHCEMTNMQRSGNRFSADMHCTGKTGPMDGHIESTSTGDHTVAKIQMQMQGMATTMNMEGTRIGTACETTDYAEVAKNMNAKAQAQVADTCARMADQFSKNARDVAGAAMLYAGPSAQCASHATMKSFCEAVQKPAGFASLSNYERSMGKSDPSTAPLANSMKACNLGAPDAMRTRLLATAEKQNDWDFLVAEGNEQTYAMLTATARRECAGRSYTNQPASKYQGLCSKYATQLARGDRAAAKAAAGVPDSGASAGAATSTSGSAAPAPAAADPAASGDAQESQKSKARDALERSKKKLKGLFGGGGD